MDQARRRLPFHRPTTVPSTSTIPSKVFSTSPERRYTPSTSTPSSSPTTASSSPLPTSPYSPAHYNLFPRAHHASHKAAPPSTHGRDTVLIRRHQSPDEISHTRDPSDRRTRRTREEDAESYAYARTQSVFAGSSSMPSSPTRPYDEYPQRKRVLPLGVHTQHHHPHHHNNHQRLHGSSTDRARLAIHTPQYHRAGPFVHTLSQDYREGHHRRSHSPTSRPSTSLSSDYISRCYSSSVYGPSRPGHQGVANVLTNDDMDMDIDVAFPPALDEFLPRASLDDAAEDQSEGEDEVVLFASPRRRVSFSTSNERDTPLPPRLPSLIATIKSQAQIPARTVGLPTPPASEPSETPERDRDVLAEAHMESGHERGFVEEVGNQTSAQEGQSHRRTRSRPTLMDLLSGPACPPSSPVKDATAGVQSGNMGESLSKYDRVVDIEPDMLPTPEDEVSNFGVVTPTERQLLSESSDQDTALSDRASTVPSTAVDDSPIRQSSPLPPSSPPQLSSPLKDAPSTVFSPGSSPSKDSLPPSSPIRSSSSHAYMLESPLLSRRMSTPPAPLRRIITPPLRQRTRTPATPEPSYEESANDLLSSPLSPEPIPDVEDEAETATFVGTPEQAQVDIHIESQEEDDGDELRHSMSSPLSPAPSSRASSLPALTARGHKRAADDVLPTLPPIKRARVQQRKAAPVYTDDSESEDEVVQAPVPRKARRQVASEDQSEDEAPTKSRATKKGKRAQQDSDDGAPVKKTAGASSRDYEDEEDAHSRPRSKMKRAKAAKSRQLVESESDVEAQADTAVPTERRASMSSTRSSPPPHSRQPSPSLRHSTPSDHRPQGKRTRGRKKSAGGDATAWRALENVDWSSEAPVPLPELEGMIIETLATARATSMSGQSILGVLMNRDSVRNSTRRRHLRSEDTDTPQQEGAGEGAEMDKTAWLHVLTHVLTTGHLGSGVFGRVDSSASDSDAPPSPPNSPAKPRMRLSHRAAQLAQWYYVPEKDADKERAGVVKSMMRGPGKRTETKKYKQYYWRPLGKISRWDPEDDL